MAWAKTRKVTLACLHYTHAPLLYLQLPVNGGGGRRVCNRVLYP